MRTLSVVSLIALIVIALRSIAGVPPSHSSQTVFTEPDRETSQELVAWVENTYDPTMDESNYALRSRVVGFDPPKLRLMFESSYERSDRFMRDSWGRLDTSQHFDADNSDLEFNLFRDEKLRVSVVSIRIGRHTNMALISAVAIGEGFTGRENIRFELMPSGELRGSIIVAGKLFRISSTPTPNTVVITEMDLDGVSRSIRVDLLSEWCPIMAQLQWIRSARSWRKLTLRCTCRSDLGRELADASFPPYARPKLA